MEKTANNQPPDRQIEKTQLPLIMKHPVLRSLTIGAASWILCASTQALAADYTTVLSGPAESPPNASPGTGAATLSYDPAAHTMLLYVTFSGLLGNVTAAHIHGPTAVPGAGAAGVATTLPTFAGFPLGVASGTFTALLDLTLASSWNPGFITANGGDAAGAEAALATALENGAAYLNIHTDVFPGGEIRGFWTPSVPDAAGTAGLLAMATAGLAITARFRVLPLPRG